MSDNSQSGYQLQFHFSFFSFFSKPELVFRLIDDSPPISMFFYIFLVLKDPKDFSKDTLTLLNSRASSKSFEYFLFLIKRRTCYIKRAHDRSQSLNIFPFLDIFNFLINKLNFNSVLFHQFQEMFQKESELETKLKNLSLEKKKVCN